MTSLWAPFAVKRPGPPEKVGYDSLGFGNKGPKRGDVKHSAEGSAAGLQAVLHGARRASWHFSVLYGSVLQHYPINAHCWHAGDTDDDGGVRANIELVGIEHEGVAGQPLTDYQVEMTTEITKFCAKVFERDAEFARYPVMPAGGWTLTEHHEVSNTFTACPSGRIPWAAIMEELTMPTEEELKRRAYAAQVIHVLEAYVAQGLVPPEKERNQVQWLLNAWR